MEKRRNIPRLCSLLTAALALLGVGLRSACMLTCFEADIGYFTAGILPALSNALYFVALALPMACMALTPRESLSTELHTEGRAPVSILLSFALAAFTMVLMATSLQSSEPMSKLTLTSNLLGISAAVYYLVSAPRNGRFPDWLSFLGYLPIFWSVAAVAETYFNNYVAMNSPVKIALQTGMLGYMLIVLAELRFRVGKVRAHYSVILLSVGSYACLVGSLPLLIAACAGIIDHLRHIMYAVVLLCAGIYGLYILLRYTFTPSTEESAEASSAEPPTTAE